VRILVVDDDQVFRDELAELLRDEGHVVATEPSVAKALDWLGREEADVVLTDLKMPRQSGLELLKEVRARWPRTLVVVLTGFATIETALESMKSGAFDYIRKPFKIDQVKKTLELVQQEHAFGSPSSGVRDPLREAKELASGGREVLFFGEAPAKAIPRIEVSPLEPGEPSRMYDRADSFLTQHPGGAVVVTGLERILEGHRLEDVVAILDKLRTRMSGHGPLRVAFDPAKVSESQAVALGGAVVADDTHIVLEALANPIRRKVLERLAQGPAAFSEAMTAAGLDDSPKLSFHLRKLVDAGLVVHETERYRLTARGQASVRLLVDATFLPPPDGSGNLAFPGTGAQPAAGPGRRLSN
jgi:FixJ family two-component response regulator